MGLLSSLSALVLGDAPSTTTQTTADTEIGCRISSGATLYQFAPHAKPALLYGDVRVFVKQSSLKDRFALLVEGRCDAEHQPLRPTAGGDEHSNVDDLDAEEDQLVFLLHPEMHFRKVNSETHAKRSIVAGRSAYTWRNADKSMHYLLCFQSTVSQQQLATFERVMAIHLFGSRETVLPSCTESALSDERVPTTTTFQPPAKATQEVEGSILNTAEADLYLFNPQTTTFELRAQNVIVKIVQVHRFEFWLDMTSSDSVPILNQPFELNMSPTFDSQNQAFIWIYQDTEGQLFSLSLKFSGVDSSEPFRETFTRCMWETNAHDTYDKIAADEHDFVQSSLLGDVDMGEEEEEAKEEAKEAPSTPAPSRPLRRHRLVDRDDTSSEDEDSSSESDVTATEEDDTSSSDNDSDHFVETPTKSRKNRHKANSALAVGYRHNRSFVLRGSEIAVYSQNEDHKMQFETTIDLKNLQGRHVEPAKMMLHQADAAMVLHDASRPDTLLKLDLERGAIVEDWSLGEDTALKQMGPSQKYAQTTDEQTFVGISDKALFKVDPRQRGHKIVANEQKSYTSKVDFSALATTGKGELVVASEKGDLRLYDKLDKRAKTHLPGLGDAIIGVDVQEDGQWLLATCKTHLLLVPTVVEGREASGFTKSLGSDKPKPIRLHLRPEHIAMMGQHVNFTVARFNTGQKSEKVIVTSSGPYLITWNLAKAKKGQAYCYEIKQYPSNVVAESFKYGEDQHVIVALPNDITSIARNKFSTPEKMLGTPRSCYCAFTLGVDICRKKSKVV